MDDSSLFYFVKKIYKIIFFCIAGEHEPDLRTVQQPHEQEQDTKFFG